MAKTKETSLHSVGVPRLPSPGTGRKVLILTPRHWFVEECCVQANPSATPSAPLMLAALLRRHGHLPQVRSYFSGEGIRLNQHPEAIVFYSPFHLFLEMTAPIINVLRQAYPDSPFILVMYDSLADCEEQALLYCPELDYAVLPHEKEMSVLEVVEHGQRRCPGGFDPGSGLIFRDQNGQPQSSGTSKALPNLDHLPYMGDELAIYWRENDNRQYKAAAVTFQRGCPNPCSFCPLRGTRPRYRDPQLVAREMDMAHQITGSPYLLSLEVLHQPQQVHDLCDLLLARNLRLADGLGARCDYINDQDLLDKLARAGLSYLYFGVEAASETMRARLRKPISNADLGRAVAMAGRAGLGFTCSFITGLPWEDAAYYQDFAGLILELARQPHFRRLNLARLQPWPGLPISREMLDLGLMPRELSFQEWNQPYEAVKGRFRRTCHLGHDDLEQLYHFLGSLPGRVRQQSAAGPAAQAAGV
ncbi:MAG: radical SAM protein [Desulfarculus sp.]|nr:radical SAM protein [Desulfarculus sp.]